MFRLEYRHLMFVLALLCMPTASAFAEGKGQADLDKAVDLQLEAKSMKQFEEVAKLCESALEKGLDEGNTKFAKQILVSALFQHASRISAAILNPEAPNPRWPLLRQFALKDLEKIIQHDPKMGDAQLMIAKLQTLPAGDTAAALKAAEAAIKLFDDHNIKRAEALVLKARLGDDPEQQAKDLAAAREANPDNVAAWQAHALLLLKEGKFEDAVKELNKLLEQNKDNVAARLALSEAYFNMEKYDEAKAQADKVIEKQPESSLGYTMRARLHAVQDDLKSAVADLNQALLVQPRDVNALLLRARLHHASDETALARTDVNRILQLRPNLPQGLYLKSIILAAEEKFDEAIPLLERLSHMNPDSVEWSLQLASMYQYSGRPRKAIKLYGKLIDDDASNWMALRARADAYLSIGNHKDAIADYEVAVKEQPEHDGILNNLAWVLCTSPQDDVRNGKRAIELAKRACEATEYKKAHILSTLAAAYAESGDFEKAKEWSAKAVEMGDDEVSDQLKEELESYKAGKPWRELQETKEKAAPVDPADLRT